MIKKFSSLLLILITALFLTAPANAAVVCPLQGSATTVSSLDLVNNPQSYLNKNVKITAVFDKFSTIGLDYKPAFRDSKDYISFLIRRDDAIGHVIPLSELKILINRKLAEAQLADIESADKIVIEGKVFSTALGDPWIEACKITILTPKPKKEKKAEEAQPQTTKQKPAAKKPVKKHSK
jgi:hypothetical protein